jgi:hypothetical protein
MSLTSTRQLPPASVSVGGGGEPGSTPADRRDLTAVGGRGYWPPLDVSQDDPRVASLAGEVAARFGRYCDGMSPDTFERLVRRAAWIRLRWPS